MKIALGLLVILTTGLQLGFSNEDELIQEQKFAECEADCSEKEKELVNVCVGNGTYGHPSRCEFNCENKVFKNGKEKEVDCKRGYEPYCWNFECTPNETIKKGEWYCNKEIKDGDNKEIRFPTECGVKCFSGKYKENGHYSC